MTADRSLNLSSTQYLLCLSSPEFKRLRKVYVDYNMILLSYLLEKIILF
jgi:hypothetical protein